MSSNVTPELQQLVLQQLSKLGDEHKREVLLKRHFINSIELNAECGSSNIFLSFLCENKDGAIKLKAKRIAINTRQI